MSEVVITGLVTFFGLLFIFILNKVYENRGNHGHDNRGSDPTVSIYQELLHITTVVAQIDTGMGELIRMHNDSDSKFATVKLRDELRELRMELNRDIDLLRVAVDSLSNRTGV